MRISVLPIAMFVRQRLTYFRKKCLTYISAGFKSFHTCNRRLVRNRQTLFVSHVTWVSVHILEIVKYVAIIFVDFLLFSELKLHKKIALCTLASKFTISTSDFVSYTNCELYRVVHKAVQVYLIAGNLKPTTAITVASKGGSSIRNYVDYVSPHCVVNIMTLYQRAFVGRNVIRIHHRNVSDCTMISNCSR